MTDLSRGISRFIFLALAGATLTTSACTLWAESCSCPGARFVTLPPLLTDSHIASVSAGTTCATRDIGFDRIEATSNTGATCDIIVQLMNGVTYRVSVTFGQLDPDGCCAGVYTIVGDPTFQQIDGGDGGVDGA